MKLSKHMCCRCWLDVFFCTSSFLKLFLMFFCDVFFLSFFLFNVFLHELVVITVNNVVPVVVCLKMASRLAHECETGESKAA